MLPERGLAWQSDQLPENSMLRRLVAAATGTVCALTVGLASVEPANPRAQNVIQGPQGRGAPPRDQPPGERKGTATIRGRVTALDTGRPLRRARINVNAAELQETRNVSTGSDGRFEIANLPAGNYSVSVVRGGYLRLGYGQKRPGDPPGRVELADGQVVSDVNFVLPRMSVISGRVFDEVGEPIAGVTITAQQMRFYEGRRKLVPLGGIATTDDTGQYRLLNLEPGEYYVLTNARETWESDGQPKETLAFVPTYFPSAPNAAGAQRVKVAAGQDASGTDISLIAGRVIRISGTAHTSQGTPAAGQTVSLGQSLRSPTGFMSMWSMDSVKVGPDGSFSLRNVPPGEYNLNLRLPANGDAPAESAALTLTVAGSDIEGVVLTTGTGGSMSGRVVFDGNVAAPQPAAQFRVVTRPLNRDGPNTGASPDNGRVRPDWSFALTAVMGANRIGMATLPPGWAVKSIDAQGRDLADSPVEFSAGEKYEDVVITLTNRFPTLAGTTTDRKGAPIEAMVIVFADDQTKWAEDARMVRTVRSDKAGTFKLPALPPGDYLAIALEYVLDGDWNDPQFLESLRDRASRVSLREGEGGTVALQVRTGS
jgi:Carboxypeptidase regulatory-like domain